MLQNRIMLMDIFHDSHFCRPHAVECLEIGFIDRRHVILTNTDHFAYPNKAQYTTFSRRRVLS